MNDRLLQEWYDLITGMAIHHHNYYHYCLSANEFSVGGDHSYIILPSASFLPSFARVCTHFVVDIANDLEPPQDSPEAILFTFLCPLLPCTNSVLQCPFDPMWQLIRIIPLKSPWNVFFFSWLPVYLLSMCMKLPFSARTNCMIQNQFFWFPLKNTDRRLQALYKKTWCDLKFSDLPQPLFI